MPGVFEDILKLLLGDERSPSPMWPGMPTTEGQLATQRTRDAIIRRNPGIEDRLLSPSDYSGQFPTMRENPRARELEMERILQMMLGYDTISARNRQGKP